MAEPVRTGEEIDLFFEKSCRAAFTGKDQNWEGRAERRIFFRNFRAAEEKDRKAWGSRKSFCAAFTGKRNSCFLQKFSHRTDSL